MPQTTLGAAAFVMAWLAGVGCASAPRESVKPGINAPYENADPDEFEKRFETESREVYRERLRIVEEVGLRPGMHVADVGAGTGLFTQLFLEQLAPTGGRVYAVDITPTFLEHIRKRAPADHRAALQTVQCREDSVLLPQNSVDLVFLCDTYHHFEYPAPTMASIHRALRDGGELVVVDFERIPGVSTDWVLGHVRAGRDETISEIAAAGFTLVQTSAREADLSENYLVRFRKAPASGAPPENQP